MDHSMKEPVGVPKPEQVPSFPSKAYMWKKGQSGNPAGGSQKARLRKMFVRYLDEYGLDEEIFKSFMAEMVGRRDEQEYIDPNGKTRRRKPNLEYFKVFMQVLYGDQRSASQPEEFSSRSMGREEALFVVKQMAAVRHEFDQRRLAGGIRQITSDGESSSPYPGDGFSAEPQ